MTLSLHHSWVKSTYSGDNLGSNCLEWAPAAVTADSVPVRDSKNPGPELRVSPDAWAAFVGSVRTGDFPAA
ncbi:DUF397 domain-containing protein [Streptomyces chattanoogensis]|uniref:DUF397 domain-containing protein n=1 Tax=Streptomyces chattanoogensis TaxID=66876 RepID=UPI0036BBD654